MVLAKVLKNKDISTKFTAVKFAGIKNRINIAQFHLKMFEILNIKKMDNIVYLLDQNVLSAEKKDDRLIFWDKSQFNFKTRKVMRS